MRRTLSKSSRFYSQLFGVAILSFAIVVASAQAQDAENDGLTDAQESAGIQLFQGVVALPDGTNFLERCTTTSLATDSCVDPAGPDVFLILVRVGAGSLIPANPLAFMVNLTPSLGVHEISNNAGRCVLADCVQKAIRITESLDTNDVIWGRSLFQGTPNTAGEATVFTARIRNRIISAYQQAGVVNATQQQNNINNCIRHTIAHEGGHNKAIAAQYNSRYGGNHYSASTQVVMSQNATITTKPGKVTIVCPQAYASPDSTGFRLK